MKDLVSGRLNRKAWLVGLGIVVLILVVIGGILATFGVESEKAVNIFLITAIFLSIFEATLHIRRFHDIGKSGWLVLLFFIPGVNLVLLALLAFMPGDAKANKFGPVSKGISLIGRS